MNLIIFVEEKSMAIALSILISKLKIDDVNVQILAHRGKSHLRQALREKRPNWKMPDTRFIVLQDNDRKDCLALKQELINIVESCGKSQETCIRIVCQELEAWFLGDKDALVEAGYLRSNQNPRELREPDSNSYPSRILDKWKPGGRKVDRAKEIAEHMLPSRNKSASFRHTICAIVRMTS